MKRSERTLSHFRFIRYKSHMDEEALGQDFLRKHKVLFFSLSLPAYKFFILVFHSSTIDAV